MTQCIEVRDECYRCRDEYYRMMAVWAKSLKTHELANLCHALAQAYEKALDKLHECLKNATPTDEVIANLALVSEYKLLLIADVEMLADFTN